MWQPEAEKVVIRRYEQREKDYRKSEKLFTTEKKLIIPNLKRRM